MGDRRGTSWNSQFPFVNCLALQGKARLAPGSDSSNFRGNPAVAPPGRAGRRGAAGRIRANMRALRLLRIVHTIGRFGLDEFLPRRGMPLARWGFRAGYPAVSRARPRGERLRLALE